MDEIFGSSPEVSNQLPPTQSAINPAQQQLLQILSGQLGQFLPGAFGNIQGGQPAIPAPYGGQFAAPLGGQESTLIDQITGAVGPGGQASAPLGSAQQALTQILSGQPQDFSQYFHDTIATPLENTFEQRTVPSLKAAFARSAGGTNSVGANTGYSSAVGRAASDMGDQLQRAATTLGTAATTQAMQNQVQGVGLAPGLSRSILDNLTTGLGAAGLPRQVQQQQLGGQQNQAAQALQFLSSLMGSSSGVALQPTLTQGNTVLSPGQMGLFPSALTAFAGGFGGSLSDPRAKVIKGETNSALEAIKRLTVKDARYKWEEEDATRPMLMADNVEKVIPFAAKRVHGVGFIKPAELIALLVKGVQELSKEAA